MTIFSTAYGGRLGRFIRIGNSGEMKRYLYGRGINIFVILVETSPKIDENTTS
jgi:hypothetical protein